MAVLENSGRNLLKATHAALNMPRKPTGRAVEKASFVRSLRLQTGEIEHLRRSGDGAASGGFGQVLDIVEAYEPQPLPSLSPSASGLAAAPFDDLKRLGEAVLERRTAELRRLAERPAAASRIARDDRTSLAQAAGPTAAPERLDDVAAASNLVAFARSALAQFYKAFEVSPVGLLHLERIEMAPAGIERGELIATIPLAPSESTNVVQKEWSVTSEEFSEIVTDYLETYSEKGVTEKTELATATESQNKHSQQLGLDGSISGSYGFVTFSAKSSFDMASSNEQAKKNSRSHAQDVTSKASARVRKERKVTIQTSSVTGSENTTTRTLVNPSSTESVRIDYYSMMRKWRVRLFQYGLRLTYDLAIPEPVATLRRPFIELSYLDWQLSQTFVFALKSSDITAANYMAIAEEHGAIVIEAPPASIDMTVGGIIPGLVKGDTGWKFFEWPFAVPDGYHIARIELDANVSNAPGPDNTDPEKIRDFQIFGLHAPKLPQVNENNPWIRQDLTDLPGSLKGKTGAQRITIFHRVAHYVVAYFYMRFDPNAEQIDQWRSQTFETIRNAAQDRYYANQQALAQRRDALRAQIANVDTLTLRREERDEIMKGVLLWLLGPDFDFMPAEIESLFDSGAHASFTGDRLPTRDGSRVRNMLVYQEMVKFIHQAIEWENLLYFPYPYFWDVPTSWEFVRTIRHPDLTRQQMLRSGSARVVLTIRPGYEEAFSAFVDNGELGSVLPPEHPYFTIGEELRAFADTNYPGLPPANPESDYRPLLTPHQRKAWQDVRAVVAALERHKAQTGAYPTTEEGVAALDGSFPAEDPWGAPYRYASPGAFNDFEFWSDGGPQPTGSGEGASDATAEKPFPITSWATCNLIAEWFEYTPSHGVDIEINTAPAAMS